MAISMEVPGLRTADVQGRLVMRLQDSTFHPMAGESDGGEVYIDLIGGREIDDFHEQYIYHRQGYGASATQKAAIKSCTCIVGSRNN
jgi:hypothetical protein